MKKENKSAKRFIQKNSLSSLIGGYASSDVVRSLKAASEEGRIVSLRTEDLSLPSWTDERNYSPKFKKEEEGKIRFPLLVYQEEGKNYVLDGVRRYLRAKEKKDAELPCIFVSGTEDDYCSFCCYRNKELKENPLVFTSLFLDMKKKGKTEKDIRELSGFSHGQVANLVRLSSLPEPVKDLVADGTLPYTKARLLIGFSEEEAVQKAEEALRMNVRECENAFKKKRKIFKKTGIPPFEMEREGNRLILKMKDEEDAKKMAAYLEEEK